MSNRDARRQLRALRRRNRRSSWAVRLVKTGEPQSARTWLVAAGLDDDLARRYAPAFSLGVTPTAVGTVDIKLGHLHTRHTVEVPIKRYDRATFLRRFRRYRPQNPEAAEAFALAAASYL